MRKSVAIYGGSFDPPHVSHVLAAVYALKIAGFERVLVVPVFEHAFHKQLTPFEHRTRMCELAFAGITGVGMPVESNSRRCAAGCWIFRAPARRNCASCLQLLHLFSVRSLARAAIWQWRNFFLLRRRELGRL